ncbi:MAG: MotA/TolQ/ExbB proton channel family protein [Acidobacteria bacterium]|nr:MAG: MotA/TolQ/ExbB proton channel family protein [Acidobacteriota bacterium]RPJ77151.1 MAG: MotA/TolQ/ExbB proton channel family protein [Acidobacteriota bacterium]
MWSYFAKGGPVMWPLLVLSILAVVVVVWRWLALRAATRNSERLMAALRERLEARDPMGAVAACDAHPGSVANIVKAALLRLGRPKDEIELALQDASAHELMVLERGLPVLATVAMVAPLLGFLGTVTGMINSFDALAAVGLNNPAAVASGISEALITTAAGLIIAIPVQMAYNYFVVRVNGSVRQMESAANLVLEAITDVRLGETTDEASPASPKRLAVPNPNPNPATAR